jgi:hypothetical protein
MPTTDYAASIQGVGIRVTRLDEKGNLLTGDMDSYVTSAFIRVSFTPEYEDGEEITEKAADGTVCISYKAPDTLKRVNLELAVCTPDPELTNLMSGGLLLTDEKHSLGWASAQVGEDPSGNGVAVEVWSRAIDQGKPAGDKPYFHWVFPYVKTRLSGDRVIENGLLATTFEGWGVGNLNFRAGIDGSWLWPAAADRPYMYARSDYQVSGSTGFRTWTPRDVSSTGLVTAPMPQMTSGLPTSATGTNTPNTVAPSPYAYNSGESKDHFLSLTAFAYGTGATAVTPDPAWTYNVTNPSPTGSKQPSVVYLSRGDTHVPLNNTIPGQVYTLGTNTGRGAFTSWGANAVPAKNPSQADVAKAMSAAGFAPAASYSQAWGPTSYIVVTDTSLGINQMRFSWNGVNWVPYAGAGGPTGP